MNFVDIISPRALGSWPPRGRGCGRGGDIMKMFHSRVPEEILDYILNSKHVKPNLERSKKVKESVLSITERCLNELSV